MDYLIRFTDDLPDGHDFVLIHDCDRGLIAAMLRHNAISESLLEEAWAAYRAIVARTAPAPLRSVS